MLNYLFSCPNIDRKLPKIFFSEDSWSNSLLPTKKKKYIY